MTNQQRLSWPHWARSTSTFSAPVFTHSAADLFSIKNIFDDQFLPANEVSSSDSADDASEAKILRQALKMRPVVHALTVAEGSCANAVPRKRSSTPPHSPSHVGSPPPAERPIGTACSQCSIDNKKSFSFSFLLGRLPWRRRAREKRCVCPRGIKIALGKIDSMDGRIPLSILNNHVNVGKPAFAFMRHIAPSIPRLHTTSDDLGV